MIFLLIDNCVTTLYPKLSQIAEILLRFESVEHVEIRCHVGKCWLAIIKNDETLFNNYCKKIFEFFLHNTKISNYNMNFNSSEFFLYLIDDKTEITNKKINELLFNSLTELIPKILEFIKLSNNDLCSIECGENKTQKEDSNIDDDFVIETDGYNVNWTLRKCGSKFLDKLSFIYKDELINILKNYLEEGIQSKDWRTK